MEEDDSSSQKQQELANVIKGTHAELRLKVQKVLKESPSSFEIEKIEDDIWAKHAQDVMSSDQKSYASAMGTLAREIWEAENDVTVTSQSRIDWIKRHLDKYFYENAHKRFKERMERKLHYLNDDQLHPDAVKVEKACPDFVEKIRVLDVGSCYNPLARFSSYQVVALDLSPAPENDGVYQVTDVLPRCSVQGLSAFII
jgi:25S rRNA (adenine2142-N1)-methyltransferase